MRLADVWRLSPRYRALQQNLRNTSQEDIQAWQNAVAALQCEQARLWLMELAERDAFQAQDTQELPIVRRAETEPIVQLPTPPKPKRDTRQ